MKKRQDPLFSLLITALAAGATLFCFAAALDNLERGREAETKQQLEAALRRASVACYAAEGVYPPDLAYLQEHYGIRLDEADFVVRYDLFAENLMPDITVLENPQ